MTLKYDELLSNFAFKFNLRRYNKVLALREKRLDQEDVIAECAKVWQCRLKPVFAHKE